MTSQQPFEAQTSKRRRFQPPITTFFSRADCNPSSALTSHPPEALSSPPLPHTVQSSLLTVGMRIRKSVPEGYKTKFSSSSYFLNSVSSAVAEQSQQQPSGDSDGMPRYHGFAELAPYCGILKTGNLAVQPFPTTSNTQYNPGSAEDPFSSLPSSQDSTITSISTDSVPPSNPNKRPFLDDDESDNGSDPEENIPNIWSDTTTTTTTNTSLRTHNHNRSTSYPISHTRMPNLNTLLNMSAAVATATTSSRHTRAFAFPKSRRKKSTAIEAGQENDFIFSGGMEVEDFGEAAFLKERRDVDVEFEVEMGGV